MSYVVAVAAPIGGGKTSLVNAIAKELEDAATIHYDHYEKITETSVQDLKLWMRNGADFDDFIIPNLANDLNRLKRFINYKIAQYSCEDDTY